MLKLFLWFFVIVGAVICGLFAYNFLSSISPISIGGPANKTVQLSYTDFVSIMLTAVSIILAALGFVIALLAFIGWNSIGNRVSQSAKEFLRESVKDGGELHRLVKNEAKEIIYKGVQPIDEDYDEDSEGEA